MDNVELARYIDLTLLKPDASREQIDALCAQALRHGTRTVCVNSCHVSRVEDALKGSSVKPIAVVGFPLGAMVTEAKAYEAGVTIGYGAREIDMVMNIGAFKDGYLDDVQADIQAVADVCDEMEVALKVIIETALLTTEQIVLASGLVEKAGALFVKTSTGFCPAGGATIEAVRAIHSAVRRRLGIKASGGIKTREQALAMINAGATRLGVSDVSQILV